MNVPEKHKAKAHAWVDGAEIQLRFKCGWIDDRYPAWFEENEYRVKPPRKKYRVYKWRGILSGDIYIGTVDSDESANDAVKRGNFIEWLGDWIEYD